MKTIISKHFSSLNIKRTSDIREENISAVIYTILTHTNISRKQIVEITGLAPSTVSGITDLLFDNAFIRQIGNLSSNYAGRRSEILSRNPNAAYVATVYLTPERCQIGIVNLAYQFIEKEYIDFENGFKETETEKIIERVNRLIRGKSYGSKVLAIGLALPHHPFDNDFIMAEFKKAFSQELQEVVKINNIEAMAMFEYYEKLSLRLHSLIYVYIGSGIGSGIIINGSLYKGVRGDASDLGHMYITDKPLVCRCGRKGCLETVASEIALSKAFVEHFGLKKPLSRNKLMDFISDGIKKNDNFIISKLNEAAFYLSRAFFNLVTILDPQEIVITGRINRLNPYFSNMVEKEYLEHSKQSHSNLVPLNFLPLHEDAGLKGIAMYSYISLYCNSTQRGLIWNNKKQFHRR